MTLKHFNTPWFDCPIAVVDFETTRLDPRTTKPCAVGLALFKQGKFVCSFDSKINPGIRIEPEATAVHGLTDADVAQAMTLDDFFAQTVVRAVICNAQLCAYNARFDSRMVPWVPGIDPYYPWLDPLVMVRTLDKFVRGAGRHTLAATCKRHGVELLKAHDAQADATATGELLYKLVPKIVGAFAEPTTMGELLEAQQIAVAQQWYEHAAYASKQPPKVTP